MPEEFHGQKNLVGCSVLVRVLQRNRTNRAVCPDGERVFSTSWSCPWPACDLDVGREGVHMGQLWESAGALQQRQGGARDFRGQRARWRMGRNSEGPITEENHGEAKSAGRGPLP